MLQPHRRHSYRVSYIARRLDLPLAAPMLTTLTMRRFAQMLEGTFCSAAHRRVTARDEFGDYYWLTTGGQVDRQYDGSGILAGPQSASMTG